MAKKKAKKKNKEESKVGIVMKEGLAGKLHSGSKKGPIVKNKKQMLAIALSEARKSGEKVKPAKKRKK